MAVVPIAGRPRPHRPRQPAASRLLLLQRCTASERTLTYCACASVWSCYVSAIVWTLPVRCGNCAGYSDTQRVCWLRLHNGIVPAVCFCGSSPVPFRTAVRKHAGQVPTSPVPAVGDDAVTSRRNRYGSYGAQGQRSPVSPQAEAARVRTKSTRTRKR